MKIDSMDITINQMPIDVEWECDECCTTNTMNYEEFQDYYGEQCDWEGQLLQCEECGKKYRIKDSEWN